ncbi:MAG: ATP-binding protein [Longimicrobiaceae bacterium]
MDEKVKEPRTEPGRGGLLELAGVVAAVLALFAAVTLLRLEPALVFVLALALGIGLSSFLRGRKVGLKTGRGGRREQRLEEVERLLREAEKMEAVGRLAHGVAHDFRNLLTVIHGNLEMAGQKEEIGPEIRVSLAEIAAAASRASELTDQLIAFTSERVDTPERVTLAGTMRKIEQTLSSLLREDVELRVELEEPLDSVWSRPDQLEQVMVNLGINSQDAMPAGGSFHVKVRNLEVTPNFRMVFPHAPPGRYVLFEVADTGEGMDGETLAHIFDPRFTTKPKGSGLGLATVYRFTRQHGGDIRVVSHPGEGATFWLLLPSAGGSDALPPATAPPPLDGARHPLPPAAGTVLVVEDEPQVRRLVKRVLEHGGFSVVEAGNGAEALELAERHAEPIHVLLSDVIMPRLGGRELARRLAAVHPEAEVVFMSGYLGEAEDAAFINDRAYYLPKPFSPDDLLRTVAEATGKREGRSAG